MDQQRLTCAGTQLEDVDTLDSVKVKIQIKDGITWDQQHFILAGKQLEDGCELLNDNIQQESTSYLGQILGGGMQIFVETLTAKNHYA